MLDGRFGPYADLVYFGGKRTFAAGTIKVYYANKAARKMREIQCMINHTTWGEKRTYQVTNL
jgi:hypothetical protein